MKSRKLLALFLAIFMLASLVVPASATDVNVESTSTAGFSAANVETTVPAEAVPLSSIVIPEGEYAGKWINPPADWNWKYTISTLEELLLFAQIVEGYGTSTNFVNVKGNL